MSLSSLIRIGFVALLISSPLLVDGAYTPSAKVNLYGCSGDVCFSNGSTPWPGGGPNNPQDAYASPRAGNIEFHGSVWIDRGGWMTFDWYAVPPAPAVPHSSSQIVSVERACIENPALQYCPVIGYLWGNYAGWIVFGNNAPGSLLDVSYDKATGALNGSAWSNIIGWVPMDGIQVWLTPIGPDYQGSWAPGAFPATFPATMTTSGSSFLPVSVPPFVETACTLRANPADCDGDFYITLTPSGYPALSRTYSYNMGSNGFVGVDLSIATTYSYTITDPWGSQTTGIITVYAGSIVSSLHPDTTTNPTLLIRVLCSGGVTSLCPEGNTLRPSHVSGGLSSGSTPTPKLADLAEQHSGELRLRDQYGNPIQTLPGVKTVTYDIGFVGNLERNSIENTSYYGGGDIIGKSDIAYRFMHGSTTRDPNIFPSHTNLTYSSPGQSIGVRSYAPTTASNLNILDNDVRILGVVARVIATPPLMNVGESTLDATSLFYTSPLPFRPLYEVTTIDGFSDVQMGRPTPLSATITRNTHLGTIADIHTIHGLSISPTSVFIPNTIASFQDFTAPSPTSDCVAYQPDQLNYTGYCERSPTTFADQASTISFGTADAASQVHSFTTIPRRISTVNLDQSYYYDSVMKYGFFVDGAYKNVIYRSLARQSTGGAGTADRVFANAVKILGQASGNEIYQTLASMPQPKTTTLSRTDIINAIKKNITILTRNVVWTSGTDYTNQNIEVYKRDMNFADIGATLVDKQTIVVYGDVTIGAGYTDATGTATPRVIIALRDESGAGGHIYVKSDVSRLDASLIAERSVFSGDKTLSPPNFDHYVDEATATGIINRQLYIYGSVFSENTIGGAAKDGEPTCPKSVTDAGTACTGLTPLRYDLEHFRYYRYDATPAYPAPLARGSASMSADDRKSSLIIEYDPRILSAPPPGLENITN